MGDIQIIPRPWTDNFLVNFRLTGESDGKDLILDRPVPGVIDTTDEFLNALGGFPSITTGGAVEVRTFLWNTDVSWAIDPNTPRQHLAHEAQWAMK